MEDGFFKRLWKRPTASSVGPIRLNLEPPDATAPQPRPPMPGAPSKQGELVPGNFFLFEMFLLVSIAGKVHIGSPKVPIRNTLTGEVRWGSKPQHSYPQPDSVQIPWLDDPERGIGARQIAKPEDMLGAEGRLGDHRFRFERILDLGRNVVVYALLNPDKQTRMAYGFNRDAVEPGYLSPAEMEMRAMATKLQKTDPELETAAGKSENPPPS
jgi:hypothetical protein